MPLIPYDPFQTIRREFGAWPVLSRVFDDDWGLARGMPRVDVRETATDVVVHAEIPGLESKEDVQITVHDRHLHLSGRIARTEQEQEGNVHRTERFFGQFSRVIPLPAAVDDNGAQASYHNGILEVRLPKTAREIGHNIDVQFH